jgi:acetylornithine deacetylase/succinyl-diaminopimelate desuccinylase family protein
MMRSRTDQLIKPLESAIQKDADELENFIFEFVKIRSENPPGMHYRMCCDFLCSYLAKFGLEPIVHSLQLSGRQEPTFAVQAFLGTGGPTVYFHGHYDVVPASESSQFAPVIKDGNMFGRGTADMKAGLGLMLFAVKALKECSASLPGRIGLTFVPDEETGGVGGSHLLLQQGILGKQGIAMFTAEPTGGMVWNGSRGALSLKITVCGKSFHVGQHYKGINAFEAMLELANRLLQHKIKVEVRQAGYAITPEAARSSVMLIGGTVAGGSNFNVVPDRCTFTVDRRINPEESLEREEEELMKIIDHAPSSGALVQVEVLQRAPSSASDPHSAAARKLARSAALVFQEEPSFELCPGLLETRFYAQQHIPAFAYGPGLLSVAHGPHEFVNLRKTRDFALIYALTAYDILSGPE